MNIRQKKADALKVIQMLSNLSIQTTPKEGRDKLPLWTGGLYREAIIRQWYL